MFSINEHFSFKSICCFKLLCLIMSSKMSCLTSSRTKEQRNETWSFIPLSKNVLRLSNKESRIYLSNKTKSSRSVSWCDSSVLPGKLFWRPHDSIKQSGWMHNNVAPQEDWAQLKQIKHKVKSAKTTCYRAGSGAWRWRRWAAPACSRWRCGGTARRRSAPRSPRTAAAGSPHRASGSGPSPPGSARTSPCRPCLGERGDTLG